MISCFNPRHPALEDTQIWAWTFPGGCADNSLNGLQSFPLTTFRFGSCQLNSDQTLWISEKLVPLSPMQRRLLVCFCRHPRQVLSKQFLMDEVWGHQEVSVVSLARTVHGLRRKLVESELPDDLIRNIYSEGYLFTLPVETIGSGETSSPAPSVAMVGSSARSDARTATLESPRR